MATGPSESSAARHQLALHFSHQPITAIARSASPSTDATTSSCFPSVSCFPPGSFLTGDDQKAVDS